MFHFSYLNGTLKIVREIFFNLLFAVVFNILSIKIMELGQDHDV